MTSDRLFPFIYALFEAIQEAQLKKSSCAIWIFFKASHFYGKHRMDFHHALVC